jgi:Protein of unknown function (DUF1573)
MKKLLFILSVAFFAATATGRAQGTDKTMPQAGEAPVIKFENMNHDFDKVEEGPDYTYKFKFTNTGKGALVIKNVITPCGCTSPDWPHEPIQPGKSSEITATYHSAGRIGPFNKTLTVQTNQSGENPDLYLNIKGEVVTKGTLPAKAPEPAPAPAPAAKKVKSKGKKK